MTYSSEAKSDLRWWVTNAPTAAKSVLLNGFTALSRPIQSDASLLGLGAHCNNRHVGGQWSIVKATHHINYLETTAALFAFQAFCKHMLGLNYGTTQRLSPISITWVGISQMTVIWPCGSCGCGVLSIIFGHTPSTENIEADPEFLMSTQNGSFVIPYLIKSAKSFLHQP